MIEGIEHDNMDRKSSRLKCVLSMFRLKIRKRHVNQRDEWHSRRAFQTQLGHKPTGFSRWSLWEGWDDWVEVHLQFSVMACDTGSWAPNLWVSPSIEGNRLELSVSCIYCCTVILYVIIPRPWDFTSHLSSPGGCFCLDAYWFLWCFPSSNIVGLVLASLTDCFCVTYSAISECSVVPSPYLLHFSCHILSFLRLFCSSPTDHNLIEVCGLEEHYFMACSKWRGQTMISCRTLCS